MKYVVDIVLTNTATFEQKFIEKECNSHSDAADERELITDNIPDGWRVTYNKVYPLVTCSCGRKVACMNFTNTCDCGCDYNFSGSLLADRSQWGEETGEHWSECY